MTCTPETHRVAIATKDGKHIDLHFGHADAFAIYDYSPHGDSVYLVENRAVTSYCQGNDGDEDQRTLILRAVSDCRALFAARIGDGPKDRLVAANIEPVDQYPFEPINAAIQAWGLSRSKRSEKNS